MMTTDDRDGGHDEPRKESQSPKHGGPAIAASVLHFDLLAEIEHLRQGRNYDHGDPSGRTLLKEQDLRIVLVALKAGGRMQEHSASGPSSIQAIEGSMRVHLEDGQVELSPGSLVALESAVRHDVEALEDSAFLLTIGRTRYEQVSASHEPRS
jgi:quercetin dioxygenase-like cupin family protein